MKVTSLISLVDKYLRIIDEIYLRIIDALSEHFIGMIDHDTVK